MNEVPDQDSTARPGEPLPPVPVAEASLWERVPLVVTSPLEVFARVKRRPGWWLPGLLILVLVGLYTAVNLHTVMPENLERQLATADGGTQREMLEKQLDLFSDPPPWLRLVSGFGAGIGAWLMLLIPGLIYHLFLKLSEGKATVGQTLGVTYWAGLIPFGVKTVLSWVLLVLTGSVAAAQATGVAALLGDRDPQSLPFLLAAFFGDAFMIWYLVLLVLGFALVHGVSRQRAAVVTIATYVLVSAVQITLTLLGQAMGGASA